MSRVRPSALSSCSPVFDLVADRVIVTVGHGLVGSLSAPLTNGHCVESPMGWNGLLKVRTLIQTVLVRAISASSAGERRNAQIVSPSAARYA